GSRDGPGATKLDRAAAGVFPAGRGSMLCLCRVVGDDGRRKGSGMSCVRQCAAAAGALGKERQRALPRDCAGSGGPGHAFALFGATMAGLCALLAVIVLVLCALL